MRERPCTYWTAGGQEGNQNGEGFRRWPVRTDLIHAKSSLPQGLKPRSSEAIDVRAEARTLHDPGSLLISLRGTKEC